MWMFPRIRIFFSVCYWCIDILISVTLSVRRICCVRRLLSSARGAQTRRFLRNQILQNMDTSYLLSTPFRCSALLADTNKPKPNVYPKTQRKRKLSHFLNNTLKWGRPGSWISTSIVYTIRISHGGLSHCQIQAKMKWLILNINCRTWNDNTSFFLGQILIYTSYLFR